MQVVILAAGRGDRFVKAGYKDPKPLIQARGRAMISYALEQAAAVTKKPIVVCPDAIKFEIWHNAGGEVIPYTIGVRHVQRGAAMSLLAAAGALDENEPVMTMDCDSIIAPHAVQSFGAWSMGAFNNAYDSTILSFVPADDSARYSFLRMAQTPSDIFPEVVSVVEKQRISNVACCGVHAFRSWDVLRSAICEMVSRQDRTNEEYYVAPLHKYVGLGSTTTMTIETSLYDVIGTPEQLEAYERRFSAA